MLNLNNRTPKSMLWLGSLVFTSLVIIGCAPIGPSIANNSWLCGEVSAETTEATCQLIESNRYYTAIESYKGAVKPVNFAEAIPDGRGKIVVGNESIDATFEMGVISSINLSSPNGWSFEGRVRDNLSWLRGIYETKIFKFKGTFSNDMRPKEGVFVWKTSGDRFTGKLDYINSTSRPRQGFLQREMGECVIVSSGNFTINDSGEIVRDVLGDFSIEHPAGRVSGEFSESSIREVSILKSVKPEFQQSELREFDRSGFSFDSLGYNLERGFLEEIFTTEKFLDNNSSDNAVDWKQLSWESLNDCQSVPKLESVGVFLRAVPSRLIITDTYISPSQNKKFQFLDADSITYMPEQLLLIKYTDKTSGRKITERFDEKSKYVSSTRQVYNPRYDVVQAAVFDAQSKLAQARANDASRPCSGSFLQCVLVNALLNQTPDAQKAYDQAVAVLSRTSRMLTNEIHSDYEVEKLKIETEKASSLVFAFFDFESGKTYREKMPLKATKMFELISSPVAETDVKKQQLLSGTSSETEVDAWLDQDIPYKFDLETLLVDLKVPENKLKLAKADQMAYAKRLNGGDSSLIKPPVILSPKVITSSKEVMPYVLENSILVLERLNGMGTGFYVDESHVLTNQHVIAGSSFLDLKTFTGETFSGRVVAKDIATDLALLKVNKKGVPLKLQDSCEVNRREPIFTIGHPKGFEYSTSRGIVSAIRDMKHPFYPESGIIKRYIQIDAAISPGNSGGPLFNSDQTVIGINTWGRTDGQNLNFAVHCSEIKNFLSETNLLK